MYYYGSVPEGSRQHFSKKKKKKKYWVFTPKFLLTPTLRGHSPFKLAKNVFLFFGDPYAEFIADFEFAW